MQEKLVDPVKLLLGRDSDPNLKDKVWSYEVDY
jgi:hypothetical protein